MEIIIIMGSHVEVVHREEIIIVSCAISRQQRERTKSHVEAVRRDGSYHHCVVRFQGSKERDPEESCRSCSQGWKLSSLYHMRFQGNKEKEPEESCGECSQG